MVARNLPLSPRYRQSVPHGREHDATGTGTSGSIACQTMSFTSGSSARLMAGDLHFVVGLGCTRHQNRTTRRSVDGLLLLDVPGPNPICYLRGLFEVALFT